MEVVDEVAQSTAQPLPVLIVVFRIVLRTIAFPGREHHARISKRCAKVFWTPASNGGPLIGHASNNYRRVAPNIFAVKDVWTGLVQSINGSYAAHLLNHTRFTLLA